MTEKHLTNQEFKDMDLPAPLLEGLHDAGFSQCTPIQAAALPFALDGKDLTGQAQTGTGKTAAFLLAMFNQLLRLAPPALPEKRQPRAIVLAPTRELAIQIHSDAKVLGKHCHLKMVLVYGGTGYEQQRRDLEKGADIIIGTPGRIIDYCKQGVFDLKAIQVAVLDEADRMFDLGFIKDIRFLYRSMPDPDKRLNMLFSATLGQRVHELAYEHMNEPEVVRIESETLTADKVVQYIHQPANDEKIPLLLGLVKSREGSRILVFINTKHVAETINLWLQANGVQSAVLSGDVPQKKRERLLDDFKSGKVSVMVATDVAARGLHIADVNLVINYDLPQDAEDYVHRVGRTARAGASGEAVSFVCEQYAFSLPDIEKYISHTLEVKPIGSELLLADPTAPKFLPTPHRRSSGGDRGRPSRGSTSRPRTRDTAKDNENRERQTRRRDEEDRARLKSDRPKREPTFVRNDDGVRRLPVEEKVVVRRAKPEIPALG